MLETSHLSYDVVSLPNTAEVAQVEASPTAEEIDILNVYVMIDIAPDRPCETIRVKLVYAARSIPIPADDPWAE